MNVGIGYTEACGKLKFYASQTEGLFKYAADQIQERVIFRHGFGQADQIFITAVSCKKPAFILGKFQKSYCRIHKNLIGKLMSVCGIDTLEAVDIGHYK